MVLYIIHLYLAQLLTFYLPYFYLICVFPLKVLLHILRVVIKILTRVISAKDKWSISFAVRVFLYKEFMVFLISQVLILDAIYSL